MPTLRAVPASEVYPAFDVQVDEGDEKLLTEEAREAIASHLNVATDRVSLEGMEGMHLRKGAKADARYHVAGVRIMRAMRSDHPAEPFLVQVVVGKPGEDERKAASAAIANRLEMDAGRIQVDKIEPAGGSYRVDYIVKD